jgi:hypothetical protein
MWNVIAHFNHSQPLCPENLLNIFFIPEQANLHLHQEPVNSYEVALIALTMETSPASPSFFSWSGRLFGSVGFRECVRFQIVVDCGLKEETIYSF